EIIGNHPSSFPSSPVGSHNTHEGSAVPCTSAQVHKCTDNDCAMWWFHAGNKGQPLHCVPRQNCLAVTHALKPELLLLRWSSSRVVVFPAMSSLSRMIRSS